MLIEPHSTEAIPPSPKVSPGKVALPSDKLSVHADRGLTLKPSDRMSHTVLRGYAQTQMPMIRHGMPRYQFDTLLLAQFAQNTPDTPSQLPIQDALSVLWDN